MAYNSKVHAEWRQMNESASKWVKEICRREKLSIRSKYGIKMQEGMWPKRAKHTESEDR